HVLTGHRAIPRNDGISGERISLPSSITKTAAAHHVPLTDAMRAVIATCPQTTSALLFPSPRTGGRIKGWVEMVAALRTASGVHFKLHNLRRTCRTLMSRLNIDEDIAELAIGHQRADLVARYNLDQAWSQRVAAFEAVSAHIAGLLAAADDKGAVKA